MIHQRPLSRVAMLGAAATFIAVCSGGLISASDVGASCPSWPVCLAELGSPEPGGAWLAFAHRLIVLAASLLAVAGGLLAWRSPAADRLGRAALLLTPLVYALQIGAGGLMVLRGQYAAASLSHLTLAVAALGLQAVGAVALLQPAAPSGRQGGRAAAAARRQSATAWWAAGAAGALTLSLSAQASLGAPLVSLAGVGGGAAGAAGLSLLLAAALAFQVGRERRGDRALVGLAGLTMALALGAALLPLLPPERAGLGLGPAAALGAAALAVGLLASRRPIAAAPAPVAREAGPSLLADYLSLTKPKVISLLLATTLGAMFLTEAGAPSLWLVLWTMIGGYLAAGGAGAINCAFDGDIDIHMGRTSRRPVPSGRISRRSALIFGLALCALAIAVMLAFTTPLATALLALGILYYAVFYTRWLKRSTWQNIVVGGGAGAIPPLVGWTAVTGTLSPAALLLFAIIFYWTPPHFWALALVKQKDYARAGVPMLPVVAGEPETRWQILVYSAILVALSLLLSPMGAMGWVYLAAAALLGARFMADAWAVWRRGEQADIWRLYKYSLLYLALLFAAMVVDRALLV